MSLLEFYHIGGDLGGAKGHVHYRENDEELKVGISEVSSLGYSLYGYNRCRTIDVLGTQNDEVSHARHHGKKAGRDIFANEHAICADRGKRSKNYS
jgi:hypothetical protein